MKKKKKPEKKIPQIKKDIKGFLMKEDGNIVKKDVVKMGLGLLVLGIGLKSGMDAKAAPGDGFCDKCKLPNPPGCPYL